MAGLDALTAALIEVTASAAATSNYLWRDQEQTDGDAAISGGIDYASELGFTQVLRLQMQAGPMKWLMSLIS